MRNKTSKNKIKTARLNAGLMAACINTQPFRVGPILMTEARGGQWWGIRHLVARIITGSVPIEKTTDTVHHGLTPRPNQIEPAAVDPKQHEHHDDDAQRDGGVGHHHLPAHPPGINMHHHPADRGGGSMITMLFL